MHIYTHTYTYQYIQVILNNSTEYFLIFSYFSDNILIQIEGRSGYIVDLASLDITCCCSDCILKNCKRKCGIIFLLKTAIVKMIFKTFMFTRP